MPDSPKPIVISVITVVYNGRAFLGDAIQSVVSQNYPNVEYIVVDGGSTDGTIDIIKTYSPQLTAWISEPDKGIYDAMNKGIALATGSLIGILNSDDMLHEGVLKKIADMAAENPEADYFYGSVSKMTKQGRIYSQAEPVEKEALNQRKFKQIPYPHGGLYIRRQVFEEIGRYDLSYAINADYDLILRMINAGKKGIRLPFAVSKYRDGGASGGYATFFERRNLLKHHGVSLLKREMAAASGIAKLFIAGLLRRWFGYQR